ncbi:MAG: phosphatase PAP2 family protein [Frankiaceae bacterium]|nr:phosphatase PAP2 family protein [Frankiaceae bacterium]
MTATSGLQHVESPWRSAGPEERVRRRRLLLVVTALFAGVAGVFGFPTGREVLTGWVLLFLYAACAGNVRVWWRAVVRDWLPLFAVLFAYDFLRGAAKHMGARLADLPTLQADLLDPRITAQAHVTEPIRADELLFGGHVPTVWLQDHFYTAGTVHWWDAVAVPVYFSHFFVSLGVAVLLWALSYRLFRRYVWTLVTLTVITLATYALFPAAPPWMAGLPANGYLPEIARVVPDTLRDLGGHTVNSAVERGAAYSNRVAAMPSLHGAIPLMLLLFAWPLVRRRTRVLLGVYAIAMLLTLVYGGEHYVSDILLGYVYAAAAVYGVSWWFRRHDDAV